MRRFFKGLFSRPGITAITLLITFVILGTLLFYTDKYFWIIIFFSVILSIICSIYIMTKDEIPEYKLPWILLVLFVPVFGILIYLLYGKTILPKKEKEKYIEHLNRKIDYIKSGDDIEKLKGDLSVYNQFYYLSKATCSPIFSGNKIKYYPIGDDFYEDYLEDLSKAEKYIFIEYFIIGEGYFWSKIYKILLEKVKQGVDVRIIYDDFGSIVSVPVNFYRLLNKQGIKTICFNRFKPICSSIFNNRDHRKITVIDGKVSYTGGLNLSDEYINKESRFGVWKDSALRIEGPACDGFLALFLSMFDSGKLDVIHEYEKFIFPKKERFENEQGYILPYGDGPRIVYADYIAKNVFLNAINSAKKSIQISSPYLICDYELLNSLVNAKKRGVKIDFLIPGIPDKKIIYWLTLTNARKLFLNGINVYKYQEGFNHAKNVLVDDEIAICGSINFDYRSLAHNFECGVLMYKTSCIQDMKKDFDETFSKSKLMVKEDFINNFVLRFFIALINIFSPML